MTHRAAIITLESNMPLVHGGIACLLRALKGSNIWNIDSETQLC